MVRPVIFVPYFSPHGFPVATLIQFSFSNQSRSVAPFLRAPLTFDLLERLYLPDAAADLFALINFISFSFTH